MTNRRSFLKAVAATPLATAVLPAREKPVPLIDRIENSVIWHGRRTGTTWFHPKVCRVPGNGKPKLLMAVQTISGSDFFGPVHWSESADLGHSWSDPKPIPGLGRRKLPDGIEEGVCDTVPGYHARTKTVLFLGENVYYRDNKLTRPSEQRCPTYVVRRRDGSWSDRRKLAWDDPEATAMYSANCSQRVTLPDGKLLIPLTFAPHGRKDRSVTTVVCSFDGEKLSVLRRGNSLRLAVKRGLLEPSIVHFRNRYFMTIRAEDGHGYVSVSDDGLHWAEKRAWSWEDGESLTMSTTQQHWLAHSDGLHLVYTRKTPANINVIRWRAPLFIARVDPERLVLMRKSERVVFPLKGDGVHAAKQVALMGNFLPVNISPMESLVTVGETIPAHSFAGDTLQARIRWKTPNRLVDAAAPA